MTIIIITSVYRALATGYTLAKSSMHIVIFTSQNKQSGYNISILKRVWKMKGR